MMFNCSLHVSNCGNEILQMARGMTNDGAASTGWVCSGPYQPCSDSPDRTLEFPDDAQATSPVCILLLRNYWYVIG